jgi:hypothetical protein
MTKGKKINKLVSAVATQLFAFNNMNKKYTVSDEFEVDGKRYSIKKEVYKYLNSKGYVNLVKLIKFKN